LKSQAIFANYIEMVTCHDNGLHPVCKPLQPAQHDAAAPSTTPSPPSGSHSYQFTVAAYGSGKNMLGTSTSMRKFPEK
jgi:hypothetical protein